MYITDASMISGDAAINKSKSSANIIIKIDKQRYTTKDINNPVLMRFVNSFLSRTMNLSVSEKSLLSVSISYNSNFNGKYYQIIYRIYQKLLKCFIIAII